MENIKKKANILTTFNNYKRSLNWLYFDNIMHLKETKNRTLFNIYYLKQSTVTTKKND